MSAELPDCPTCRGTEKGAEGIGVDGQKTWAHCPDCVDGKVSMACPTCGGTKMRQIGYTRNLTEIMTEPCPDCGHLRPGLADVVVIAADGLAVYRSQTAAELWEGETCDDCGGRYERTIWWAPNELWLRLVGHDGGVLCPGCFDDRAKELGLSLIWEPRVERAEPR